MYFIVHAEKPAYRHRRHKGSTILTLPFITTNKKRGGNTCHRLRRATMISNAFRVASRISIICVAIFQGHSYWCFSNTMKIVPIFFVRNPDE